MTKSIKGSSGRIRHAFSWFFETFWRFPAGILSRPFKGFDAMKYEKKGSYAFGIFMLILVSLMSVLNFVYTGFLINTSDIYKINSLYLALTVVFPLSLFVVSNWCVTTLLDGKGKMGEIFLSTMYALFPMCLMQILSLILSNVLTLEEMSIVYALNAIGAVLFVFYLFVGQVVVHEYGFGRCLGALGLTIVAMMILVFILMLAFSLCADVLDFFTVFIKELLLKLA